MIGRHLIFVVLFAVLSPLSSMATEFGTPPSNLLFQLQRQNRYRPWLHVTLDSTRVTLRTTRFDDVGLTGIQVPPTQAPLPDPIHWRSIARIDGIETDAKKWGTIGLVVGSGLGFALGTAIGESHRTPHYDPYVGTYTTGHGGMGSLVGSLGLGALGAWQGSRFGSHRTHDREWYVAAPLVNAPASGESASPDSTAAAATMPISAAPSAAADDSLALRLAESAGVKRAIASIYPRDLIRMRGDFGQFQGHATVIGPRGMEGLRPDRNGDRYMRGPVPTGLVGWHRIDHIEKRGNGAGRGALIGAVGLGGLGAVAGAALDAGFGGDNVGGAALYGGLVVGGIGLFLGTLFGAAIPAWHAVYDGP